MHNSNNIFRITPTKQCQQKARAICCLAPSEVFSFAKNKIMAYEKNQHYLGESLEASLLSKGDEEKLLSRGITSTTQLEIIFFKIIELCLLSNSDFSSIQDWKW